MSLIPESHKDLLEDKSKALGFIATTMADGSPQVSPVWFNWDGEFVYINSTQGRVKEKNMRARPQVAMTIMKLDSPYRYLLLRGKIIDVSTEDAEAHIHALSQKHTGTDWNIPEGQVRMKFKFKVEKVFKSG
ncbi:MAG: PPOX class F420-dependent oxidoreductase [Chloroflexi bacterium]|jgi:PPOX class probable F420-dependent enzyme|nr:PPOX class F420-dependent oxidoreductase [Chloroflexota bacterium]MBT3670749.1 PPOX class F420-dependent oxidoreductase [Chloroflexota bacterium]MBT4305117.1 PPOX class F420-dependent oxidoreductase [Chloroflexota bacterium]MBT4533361.1 PPOX class F420-dependent oxidoreductase [Chloroflexota bacterium]MBT4682883.1 PPOX class F420-dependent oxidoreductase [Chloroflexota bacterium]